MVLIGKIRVTSVLPDELARLKDIAYNMWWSWNPEAIELYRDIDPFLWKNLEGNPVRFLQEVSSKQLEKAISDHEFMKKYDHVVQKFDVYSNETNTWFNRNYPDKKDDMVAYFSAEYGLSEVLPIYSGGLGILSGDHCKTASDMGIPFTAIGLFYKQGYFSQRINSEGWQEAIFNKLDPNSLPMLPVLNENGEPVHISIELPGRIVYARLWKVNIGRVALYLMDTDIESNNSEDRELTGKLYGGDQETRIQQEILLGIGGIRALETLGIKATVYHMNEGHSAFMGLELIRKLVQEKHLSFEVAKEVVSSSTIFTTHTPVPAGNDVFPFQMIEKYFNNYWESLGISRHEFLDLGLKVGDHQNFNMTVLALTLAGRKNGVSKLHGAVSRNIFKNMWPGLPEDEIPIMHVTNGIHTFTWLSPVMAFLYSKHMGKNGDDLLQGDKIWDEVDKIPDEELWNAHRVLKTRMIEYVRKKLREQRIKNGESPESVKEAETILNPDALTIGFARRFATYKRANLIFRNIARIKDILNNRDAPVQIIFAGKAHPADRPAHEIIKNINDIAKQEGFKGKVVLLENYNMTMSRYLIQGVDVWLNNPRRPLEASGTSGQKASINGVINFSILDGWWCEGYNGKNGWAIGEETFYDNEYYQDNADSESIYNILEQNIIPLFYDRNACGIPVGWVSMMKESIKSLTYRYSTHRMLKEYTELMYVPSMERVKKIVAEDYAFARNLAEWKSNIRKNWPQIQLFIDRPKDLSYLSNQSIPINMSIYLGDIKPEDVNMEIYYGPVHDGKLDNAVSKLMYLEKELGNGSYLYSTELMFADGGEYGYTFRVIPNHAGLINKFDTGLIKWAVQ